jgi:RNase H-like domain found in reverse transcriptase
MCTVIKLPPHAHIQAAYLLYQEWRTYFPSALQWLPNTPRYVQMILQHNMITTWSERQPTAFNSLKEKLTTADVCAGSSGQCSSVCSSVRCQHRPVDFAISWVLSQEQPDGETRPIAYYSRKLNIGELSAAQARSASDGESCASLALLPEGRQHSVLIYSDRRTAGH